MKRLLVACFILMLGVAASAQDDAPYLYYYSDMVDAFVIERADGTDSRLFAQGMMPLARPVPLDIGWSPSGEWYAWTSATVEDAYDLGGPTPQSIWLANLDGRRFTALGDYDGDVMAAVWSPTSDLLLVVSRTLKTSITIPSVLLIDPAADRIVAQMSGMGDAYPAQRGDSYWAQNGGDVFFRFVPLNIGADGDLVVGEPTTRLLRTDGTFEDGLAPEDISPRVPRLPLEDDRFMGESVSLDGRYTIDFDDSTITDTLTGTVAAVNVVSGAFSGICKVVWHAGSDWFWHHDVTTAGGSLGCVGGSAVSNASGTVQRDLAACWGWCVAWLPEHVVPHLPDAP